MRDKFQRDTLYDTAQEIVDFAFDERTVAVFPDMIHRSIPGYVTLLQLIGIISRKIVTDTAHVYDLGCSLGGVTLTLRQHLPNTVQITAVDNSAAMIQRLQDYVQGMQLKRVAVVKDDITTMSFTTAHLVVLNFVLQFIAPAQRMDVIQRIYDCLVPGGALLIAEKVRPQDDKICDWHEAFKAHQGYSALAIAQKRAALEKVMAVDSAEIIHRRLEEAGFSSTLPFFQTLSFRAWAAIK